MTDVRSISYGAKGFSAGGPRSWIAKRYRTASLSLRAMTFSMMLAVAVVPIAVFYDWVGRTSFENEIQQVDESHLIIAKNLSSTLSRYAGDALAVFKFVLSNPNDTEGYPRLLRMFDICHVALLDADNRLVSLVAGENSHKKGLPSAEMIAELRDLTAGKPGEIVVSGIRQNDDGSHFFIAQLMADGGLAVAPWSPRYVRELQKSIAFGELGHSMMVDHEGRVVAHPNAEWQRIGKDASKLSVVQAMLAGKTGVMQFYSPPMDADMIAGYTYVPETGWGVMVPQPIRELEVRADAVKETALYISALVVTLSVIVGLLFSKLLAAPIISFATTARRIAKGDFSARVGTLPRYTPTEIGALAHSFDEMAEELQEKNAQLTKNLHMEKRLSNERAVLLAEAQRAYAMKSQFVSTISHELRTPLTSIRGSVDLVLSGHLGPLSPKAESMLSVGKRNVGRLLSLVNDILDFSSLDSGQLPLNLAPVPAAQILAETVEANAPFSRVSAVELHADVPDVAFKVLADDSRIQQVFSNLISNAVKFSHEGSSVEISADSQDGFGVFRVTDHGIGISEEFRPRLFDRFTQEDSSDTRQVGGTGLGLAITKAIVENHGGTLDYETEIGVGTTFWFTIPLA